MAEPRPATPALTARAAGVVGCRICGLVSTPGRRLCPRCGARLASRLPGGPRRVGALLLAALACSLPANLLPMLVTTRFGFRSEATIVGGMVDLARHGAWGVAAIIGLASLVIPLTKLLVIGWLAASVRAAKPLPVRLRIRLYEIVDFIGRWSMVDVFVVAILAGLVQFGWFVSVRPGPAAGFFALSVVLTMLAARALDPRLLWDAEDGTIRAGRSRGDTRASR